MSNARKLADNLPTEGQLGGRNIIINGGQTVDQRQSGSAITLTSSHQYATDRFICRLGTSSSSTAQQVADAPEGYYNSMKLTIGTGASPAANVGTGYFTHRMEGLNVSHLNFGTSTAKTITVSFWIKCSVTGSFGITIANGALDRSYPSSYTVNSANTWEYKTLTVAGDTSGTWLKTNASGLELYFDWGNGSDYKGTANAWASADYRGGATGGTALCATSGATWQITGVQLEVGPQSTPFEHEPYEIILRKCQRYYYSFKTDNTNGLILMHQDRLTSTYIGSLHMPTEMRAAPTVTHQGMDRLHKPGIRYDTLSSGPFFSFIHPHAFVFSLTSSTSDVDSQTAYFGAVSGGYIKADAEL